MNRDELIQLRDAIDMTLALPDSVRALLAQWLAPEAAQGAARPGNGLDPHPPPIAMRLSTERRAYAARCVNAAEPF